MTSKPELQSPSSLVSGLGAVALFAVLAFVFLGVPFPNPVGFPDGANITASLGYAMFNIDAPNAVDSEGFLVAFEVIDLVLVAALVGAVMLARREDGGEVITALRSDQEADDAVATDGGTGGDD